MPLSEKNKILAWIAAGAPSGDTTLAATAPIYPTIKLIGTPDSILKMPTYTTNATTADKYVCISIPTGLTQDRILRAYEVILGNPSIVHHAVVNVDTLGTTTSDLYGSCYVISGDFSIGGYAPGNTPVVFPNVAPHKFGIKIKAGSKIVFQMHYPAGSAGQTDNTQIRLFFYPVGTPSIRPIYAATLLQNWSFAIPTNSTSTVTASYPSSGGLSVPISAYSIFPHSHKVCTKIVNYAINGTSIIPLSRINKWDFEWQDNYTFNNFVKNPAGYTLKGVHYFDNTAANPFAPITHAVGAGAGLATSDEMVFDGLMWTNYLPGDENINLDSQISHDTLLIAPVGLNNISSFEPKISVFPNPFSDKIKIPYTLEKSDYVSISFYNIMGQEVSILNAGNQTQGNKNIEWDGKNDFGSQLPSGVYTYKLNIGLKSYTGKVILKLKQ